MKLKNSILQKYPNLKSHDWIKTSYGRYKCVNCDYVLVESNGELFPFSESFPVTIGYRTSPTSLVISGSWHHGIYSGDVPAYYENRETTLLSCDENSVKDIVE